MTEEEIKQSEEALDFIKKREEIEHRHVSKEVFITSFFKSRENVIMIKDSLGDKVELNLIIKDFEAESEQIVLNVSSIDNHISLKYNIADLDKLLT